MTDLFTHAREHDLPPRWDGYPVEWTEWSDAPNVFVCSPPKGWGVCAECGSTSRRLRSSGTRVIPFDDNVIRIAKGMLHPRETRAALTAYRCPDCLHDVVVDLWTDQVWDLDVTDYGDDGSAPPAPKEPTDG